MTILPEGNPIWSRAPSIEQYGGHAEKRDYLDIGVVNSMTDVSARQFARMTADTVAIARVTPLLSMRITLELGNISVDWCAPAWAVAAAYEGATAVGPSDAYPTVSIVGGNAVHIQMPATATDEYGVVRPVVPKEVIVTSGAEWNGADISGGLIVLVNLGTSIALEVH